MTHITMTLYAIKLIFFFIEEMTKPLNSFENVYESISAESAQHIKRPKANFIMRPSKFLKK